jgi:SAM-dependent methyltransferase
MQTYLTVHNPQASQPLRIPMGVGVNTDEETILANVLANSRKVKRWVKSVEPHDGIAILCGGGPSLADNLGGVFDKQQFQRGKVFALNGAAKFLSEHGIIPDYQVIMDARLETASLVGPAREHLFASQVDPLCFEMRPDAILWHSTYGNRLVDEQEGFAAFEMKNGTLAPDRIGEGDDGYALIGSSISVGPTALILLYALGYRAIHAYGFDCSQAAGKSHAYAQPMNNGEPCTIEKFRGEEYVCSVPMAQSARQFLTRARELQRAGCAVQVHGDGFLPHLWRTPVSDLTEAEKYALMWGFEEYRDVSPGEHAVDEFIRLVEPAGEVIDFGCGTGRASVILKEAGLDPILVDFAGNGRDLEAMGLPFVEADLTEPLPVSAAHGFCADVLEHIPPADVETVIRNIMAAVDTCFFQISTVPDVAGALIGAPLHLTVENHEWWRSLFGRLEYSVAFEQDLGAASRFVVKRN